MTTPILRGLLRVAPKLRQAPISNVPNATNVFRIVIPPSLSSARLWRRPPARCVPAYANGTIRTRASRLASG